MKSIMTAVLLTAAIASPVLAQEQAPFRGTFEAIEYNSGGAFPIFVQSLSGEGHATHLGRFTVTTVYYVNVLTLEAVADSTLNAANGDTLFATGTGLATVVEGIAYIHETYTITGGTGRFAGATGNFVAGRVLVEATGISTSTFDGTIALHR
jgi:hypothetical protein